MEREVAFPVSNSKQTPVTDIITIDELSNEMRLEKKTIRQWIYKRQIPSIKLNGLVRFSRTDILRWVQESRRMPA